MDEKIIKFFSHKYLKKFIRKIKIKQLPISLFLKGMDGFTVAVNVIGFWTFNVYSLYSVIYESCADTLIRYDPTLEDAVYENELPVW